MLFRVPRPTSMTLNLAPMVDVMMCLIIFFLLGSSLVIEETRPVELPYALSAEARDRGLQGPRIVVNVRPAEGDRAGAQYIVAGWDGRRITEHVFTAEQLQAHLRASVAAAADHNDEVRCVIRADRSVAYEHVEAVMRACGRARIARVSFSAQPGPEPEGHP
jgi:biopolymer transport protein ExbD